MIELLRDEMNMQNRKSSKGNQMKWLKDDVWYKADYTGYEGLAEYVVSSLINKSNLLESDYQTYFTEKIRYGHVDYLGCKSENFLPEGWQMITLERLFLNHFGESLNKSIYRISELDERIQFLVNQTIRLTGLKDFGTYLCNLLTLDAFFLNEDRHTHNIAVLIDTEGQYQYCPIFDNGGCLLSDTRMDYPLNVDTEVLMKEVRSKTFTQSFDDQLDEVERLYGQTFRFCFTDRDLDRVLEREVYYDEEIKLRVKGIVMRQMDKYQYLFGTI